MKKLERFLDKYSGLLKFGIWVLIIFWATGLHVVIKDKAIKFYSHQKNRNIEAELILSKELTVYADEIRKSAEVMGNKYGPGEYFNDLKKIKIKKYNLEKKLGLPYEPGVRVLDTQPIFYISFQNLRSGFFSNSDLEKAQRARKFWDERGGPLADEQREYYQSRKMKEDIQQNWKKYADSLFHWFTSFYSCSVFLVLMLYLIRMSKDRWMKKGIIYTILADKKKFLQAVFLWPALLMKYPSNVVREIRVEAELRRLGKTFRRLSLKDRNLIKRIANGSSYKIWIANFRVKNEFKFKRSLLFALTMTIAINVFSPVISFSEAFLVRDGPQIAISCESEEDSEFQKSYDDNSTSNECLVEIRPEIPKLTVSRIEVLREKLRKFEFTKKIDSVPINWLFSSRMLILN